MKKEQEQRAWLLFCLFGGEHVEIVEKKLTEIQPYMNNPRKNDASVDAVAESIRQFGFKVPLVVDAQGVIITGHTRFKAAKKLGLEKVPCIVAADLDDEKVRAYRLADNKVGETSEWDIGLLAEELGDIFTLDMSDFGFDLSDEKKPDEIEEDDYDQAVPAKPKAKLGDIYLLGNHRLMCGDATSPEDIQRLMGGREADLLVTDPPYNVNYEGGTKDKLKIMNDSMEDVAFQNFLTDAFKAATAAMRPGGAFYIWHADSEGYNFRVAAKKAGLQVRQVLVWVKNSIVLGRQDYQWKHEPCLYGWKEGAGHYFVDDRTQATVIDDSIDLRKLKKDEMLRMLQAIYSDKASTTVLYENKPTVNDLHPTMKPVKLLARQIRNSTRPGDIVLDVFGGSGSTLIACEQLNRTCFINELDPRYVDVIIDRWERFTGEKAVRLNGEAEN